MSQNNKVSLIWIFLPRNLDHEKTKFDLGSHLFVLDPSHVINLICVGKEILRIGNSEWVYTLIPRDALHPYSHLHADLPAWKVATLNPFFSKAFFLLSFLFGSFFCFFVSFLFGWSIDVLARPSGGVLFWRNNLLKYAREAVSLVRVCFWVWRC